jgi:hypothetical protein
MEHFVKNINVLKLPKERKRQVLQFLADAIINKRVIMKPQHDKEIGYFAREVRKNYGSVVNAEVPLVVLVFAETVWEALVVQRRKFVFINKITATGVYGIATERNGSAVYFMRGFARTRRNKGDAKLSR